MSPKFNRASAEDNPELSDAAHDIVSVAVHYGMGRYQQFPADTLMANVATEILVRLGQRLGRNFIDEILLLAIDNIELIEK